MKVSFYTLGCKVNQHETGAMQQLFLDAGYTLAGPEEPADVYVVNSCTVTSGGDRKSRQWLRRCKRANPNAVTVLTGCMPQAFPELGIQAVEADIVTGSKGRKNILKDIQRFCAGEGRIVDILPHQNGDLFEELPAQQFEEHTRAFVKIEDGCNRFCAYCIIPYARGRVRSRTEESILQEVNALARNGYREVVLTGINLSCYGNDTGTDLADIVEKVAAIPGIQRIRLGSLEPDLLPEDTLRRLSAVDKICPQFHLSLQSGCDETLRRMNRHYTTVFYKELLQKMRGLFPGAQFTTDVIVGFPGETEEEFAKSLEFVKSCGFLKVHVFTYSARPGTAAAEMTDQVPQEQRQRRHKALAEAADAVRLEVIAAQEGTMQEILLEKPLSATLFTGYTKGYIPVAVEAPGSAQGEIVRAALGPYDGARCRCKKALF